MRSRLLRCAASFSRSFHAARGEIKRCSGTQFDPRVVEVYLSLPDQLWEDLRTEISQKSKKMAPVRESKDKPILRK